MTGKIYNLFTSATQFPDRSKEPRLYRPGLPFIFYLCMGLIRFQSFLQNRKNVAVTTFNSPLMIIQTSPSKLFQFTAWILLFPVCFLPKAVAVTTLYHRWEQRFFFEASIDSTHGIYLFPVSSFSGTVAVTIKYHCWEQRFFFEASIDSTHGSLCFRSFPFGKIVAVTQFVTAGRKSTPFPELPFYHRMGISLFPVILTKNVAVTT